MSASEALLAASRAGVRVSAADGRLLLEAPAEPPAEVIDLLARNKADLLRLLREPDWDAADWIAFFEERAGVLEFDQGLSRGAAELLAFEQCIERWIIEHPPRSSDRCAECGQLESHAVVVPPAEVPTGWVHAGCWPAWIERQRSTAQRELTKLVRWKGCHRE